MKSLWITIFMALFVVMVIIFSNEPNSIKGFFSGFHCTDQGALELQQCMSSSLSNIENNPLVFLLFLIGVLVVLEYSGYGLGRLL